AQGGRASFDRDALRKGRAHPPCRLEDQIRVARWVAGRPLQLTSEAPESEAEGPSLAAVALGRKGDSEATPDRTKVGRKSPSPVLEKSSQAVAKYLCRTDDGGLDVTAHL